MKKQDSGNSNILKKADILELNESYRKCIYWFFAYPDREIGLNDLSVVLGTSKTTARRVVLSLVEEGFLIKEELGKIWRISCNKDHFYNRGLKIAYNLEMIYLSGILAEVYKVIPGAKAIILFGSYRKGDDTENSDIDIAVEIIGDNELKIHELGTLPVMGYRKNIPVNLHIFSRNKIDLNLYSNIVNGIVLDGFLEVRI